MGDMTTISTCGKCGLHYRESLIPHQCAEWTKGRKEVAKESHQMSEYDQMVGHQVNSSGNCVISGCPCRGWSAQEGAEVAKEKSMNTNETVNALKEFGEVVEQMPSGMKDEIIRQDERERLQEIRAASHQPAARGGGDEWRTAGQVVPDCEYAIVGMTVIHKRASSELVALTRDKQVAAQIVDEHRQHQSLVAEREGLRAAIEVAIHNLNAGNDPRFLADYLRLTLDQKRGAR